MIEDFTPERVRDRLQILDLLGRTARAVDRMDWDGLRRCYHPDALERHGLYNGDVDGFIEYVKNRHVHVDVSFHSLGQSVIDFLTDDAAAVETCCVSIQVSRSPDPADAAKTPTESRGGNRYADLVTRRDGRWAFQERHVIGESSHSWPTTKDDNPYAHLITQARRGSDDLANVLRAQWAERLGS